MAHDLKILLCLTSGTIHVGNPVSLEHAGFLNWGSLYRLRPPSAAKAAFLTELFQRTAALT